MNAVITLEEVAEFLKVHPTTVYRLLKNKSIPAFKVGSDWRFNQESIERWMREAEKVAARPESPQGTSAGVSIVSAIGRDR